MSLSLLLVLISLFFPIVYHYYEEYKDKKQHKLNQVRWAEMDRQRKLSMMSYRDQEKYLLKEKLKNFIAE